MKIALKKSLALFLTLVLLFGVSVPAFAEDTDENEPVVVTCIGDSIANGHAQDWNCVKSIIGSPYNEAYHNEEIEYMSPERQNELYPGTLLRLSSGACLRPL